MSCGKFEKSSHAFESFQVPSTLELRKVVFINDSTGFAVGGTRYSSGFILKTIDGGLSWQSKSIFFDNRKVYDIHFVNDLVGFAGTEENFYYKTSDGGESWQVNWNIELAYHEVHRPDIKAIQFYNDSSGYMIGGEDHAVGTIYRTTNAGASWTFDTIVHELRALDIDDAHNALFGGYGYLARFDQNDQSLTQFEHDNNFFIGVKAFDNNRYLAVGQDGDLYTSSDAGLNWNREKIKKGSTRKIQLNYMAFKDDQTGILTGVNGMLLITQDGGSSWRQLDLNYDGMLLGISYYGNFAFISAEEGKYFRISLES